MGLLAQDITKNDLTQVHNDLTRISNAVKKMNALLYDLLELSRIGRVANLSSYFSLTEAANEAVEFLQALITEKKAEIIIESSLPQIFGDKRRIIEVLQNLIENALKFSNPGTDIRIEIGFSPEKNAFFVKDNGIGVNPKYHKKIFGLFDKLESKSEGTGIGLAIVSRIIEVHKGKIWVESEGNGKGSYFYFTINFSG